MDNDTQFDLLINDVLINDMSDNHYETIANLLNCDSRLSVDSSSKRYSENIDGIVFGKCNRVFLPITVNTDRFKKCFKVIFLYDSGSPYTFLRRDTLESLGFVGNVPREVRVSLNGLIVDVSISHNNFHNVDILGQDFMERSGGKICIDMQTKTVQLRLDNRSKGPNYCACSYQSAMTKSINKCLLFLRACVAFSSSEMRKKMSSAWNNIMQFYSGCADASTNSITLMQTRQPFLVPSNLKCYTFMYKERIYEVILDNENTSFQTFTDALSNVRLPTIPNRAIACEFDVIDIELFNKYLGPTCDFYVGINGVYKPNLNYFGKESSHVGHFSLLDTRNKKYLFVNVNSPVPDSQEWSPDCVP